MLTNIGHEPTTTLVNMADAEDTTPETTEEAPPEEAVPEEAPAEDVPAEEAAPAERAAPTDQDLLCYSERYPDLAAAFGKDVDALRRHWEKHGRSEARDPYCREFQVLAEDDDERVE